ncbi:YcgN family cysteine cluster protein [Psychrobacter okhotskensis]|uniref:YcgN family cysteine cluster protein n=1 Tax=Psychrobacter okhotskensis TaxID=212403 RepID=UPI00156664DA|nr:YcgN family cysteine cluster protein [Psychrobacter okhotskensis]NRD70783.1 YcgN family cysteine cluster protein [Psychrobacter okhotskensis]
MTINLLNQSAANLNADAAGPLKSDTIVSLFPDSESNEASETLRPQFWSRFTLAELNHSEWEALCDGCGSCCLIKYIDNDDDEEMVEYTDVTCQLMDCATGYCQHYDTRQEHVPDCIQLTMENLPQMMWLPSHCAYKRLYKGQNLPSWHLLLTQNAVETQQKMRAANVGVAGRCVSEIGMSDEEMETRVVNWVKP